MTDTCHFRPLHDLAIVFVRHDGVTPWNGHISVELWMRPHVALGEPCSTEDEWEWDTIPIRQAGTVSEAREVRQSLYRSGLLDDRLLMAWAALLSAHHEDRVRSRLAEAP